jgi:anti-sigma B factor antagonist
MANIQLDVAGMLGATIVEITYDAEQLTVFNDARGVAHVVGEIDTCTAPSLGAALMPFYASKLPLLLDLSQVRFIGSAGITELVHLHDRLNGRLEIVAVSRAVWRVMTATGLMTHLTLATGGTVEPVTPDVRPGPGLLISAGHVRARRAF